MSHLGRAGLLLLLAFSGFLFVRFASSQVTVPLVGLVKADNSQHWASLQPQHGPPTRCVECHRDVELEWSRSPHRVQSCESCHGPGTKHLEFGAIAKAGQELCVTCHSKIPGRPEDFPQVVTLDHYPTEACTTCHNPHSPSASYPQIPHSVDGRQDCLACHGNPTIARIPPNHASRPVELCMGCHKPKGEFAQ